MKYCKYKDWGENKPIISNALRLCDTHKSWRINGIKKSFIFCPYCGNKLIEKK